MLCAQLLLSHGLNRDVRMRLYILCTRSRDFTALEKVCLPISKS